MIAIVPEGLRIHERTYNGYTTVVVLRDEMRRDAARLDASAARGLRSFAAREVEHKELEAKITKLERLLSSNGGGRSNDNDRGRSRGNGDGKNGRHQFTNEQMMNKDYRPPTGVPWKFTHFCSVHGHSTTHSDDRCFVLHPELKPADRNWGCWDEHNCSKVQTPTRLPPGLYSKKLSLVRPCNNELPRLHNAYQRCLAVTDDGSIIGRSVLDTGSVRSMTATKTGRRVVPIPLSQQPLIEGAGGGTMRATHWVHRGLPTAISALLPAGAPDEMRFLYGPAFRFDVCATKELGAIGISTRCAPTPVKSSYSRRALIIGTRRAGWPATPSRDCL